MYNSSNNIVSPASFSIGSISYQKNIAYNTDLLCDYLYLPLNSNTYGFPNNPTANITSPINTFLSFTNGNFGTISSLTNILVGNNYLSSPYTFVSSGISSHSLPGNVSYSNNSNIVNGTNTFFTTYFSTNSFIILTTSSNTIETQVIKKVVNNTQIILYGNTINSSNTGTFKVSTNIIPSNYNLYDIPNSKLNSGNNFDLISTASYGNNNINTVSVINSGKGYIDNEYITAYMYNCLNPVIIINGGIGYSKWRRGKFYRRINDCLCYWHRNY